MQQRVSHGINQRMGAGGHGQIAAAPPRHRKENSRGDVDARQPDHQHYQLRNAIEWNSRQMPQPPQRGDEGRREPRKAVTGLMDVRVNGPAKGDLLQDEADRKIEQKGFDARRQLACRE